MVANNTIMIIGLIKIFRNIVIKDNGISELFKYIYITSFCPIKLQF